MPSLLTIEILDARIAQNQALLEDASKGIIEDLTRTPGLIRTQHVEAINETNGNIKALNAIKGRIEANKSPYEVKKYIVSQLAYAAEQSVGLRQSLYDDHELAQFASVLREFFL